MSRNGPKQRFVRNIARAAAGVGFTLIVWGAALGLAAHQGQARARASWAEIPITRLKAHTLTSRLSFPSLGANVYVFQGSSESNLLLGPVHVDGSAEPGEDGNCIIAGHRDTHFRILSGIKEGDRIVLERDGTTSQYIVESLNVVGAKDDRFYGKTDAPVLTLVTCYPFYYVGPAPKRFIVRARLQKS